MWTLHWWGAEGWTCTSASVRAGCTLSRPWSRTTSVWTRTRCSRWWRVAWGRAGPSRRLRLERYCWGTEVTLTWRWETLCLQCRRRYWGWDMGRGWSVMTRRQWLRGGRRRVCWWWGRRRVGWRRGRKVVGAVVGLRGKRKWSSWCGLDLWPSLIREEGVYDYEWVFWDMDST